MTDSRFPEVFIHPSAVVEDGVSIGRGTKIWMNVQVRRGAELGEECILSKDVFIDEGVRIGNRCKIQNGVSVYHGVQLEDGVFLGPHCTTTNDLDPAAINPDGTTKSASDWKLGRTLFRYGSRIGAHATIVCGDPQRMVGAWALVGSGAVVTRDVEDFSLVFGNPARHVRFVCPVDLHHRVESVSGRLVCEDCGDLYERFLKKEMG